MDIYIFIGSAVLFFAAAFMAFLKDVHMFQLNSYGVGTHLRWMGKNFSSVGYNLFSVGFLIVSFIVDFYNRETGAYIVALHGLFAIVFLVLTFADRPKKGAKTPLVFTARVKRLAVTYSVLAAVCVAAAFLLSGKGLFYILLFGFFAL